MPEGQHDTDRTICPSVVQVEQTRDRGTQRKILRRIRYLPEPLREVSVEGAQRGGFGALGAAGAALRVPRHDVEMSPGDPGLDEFLQVERGGHRTGMRRFRDVVDVGNLAVDHLAVRAPQRHAPHRVFLGRRGREQPEASASSLQNNAASSGPSATRAAPVRVAMSTSNSGFSVEGAHRIARNRVLDAGEHTRSRTGLGWITLSLDKLLAAPLTRVRQTAFPSRSKRMQRMGEGILYLLTSFWLGAVHAATPGHGKTIAASYIVGVRGRPVDALVLGVFVTLSHTSGIILVAALATLGSAWLIPQRIEAYLGVGTGILVVGIGCWMLRNQLRLLPAPREEHLHSHVHPHAHGTHYHSHGWGITHSHDIEAITQVRPKLAVLLALGIAGGLLPDPGALAILLAAIASGKFILGLLTVLVFSLGFASVLVVVGVVAAHVGQLILAWLSSGWVGWVQIGAALLIVAVGLFLTANAWRTVAAIG
jgi:nickel/cobalt transporter (NicO) family protein